MEELARAGTTGIGFGLHSEIVAPYILHYGTEAQKQKYLPQMASGAMVGAIAMSEPAAGSDLQGLKTTALKQAGGGGTLVLNLWADWEKTARQKPDSAYGVLLKARDHYGWDLHNVPTLEGLLAFARAFSKRHYAAASDATTTLAPEF